MGLSSGAMLVSGRVYFCQTSTNSCHVMVSFRVSVSAFERPTSSNEDTPPPNTFNTLLGVEIGEQVREWHQLHKERPAADQIVQNVLFWSKSGTVDLGSTFRSRWLGYCSIAKTHLELYTCVFWVHWCNNLRLWMKTQHSEAILVFVYIHWPKYIYIHIIYLYLSRYIYIDLRWSKYPTFQQQIRLNTPLSGPNHQIGG